MSVGKEQAESASLRVPVSLRVPAPIARSVENYANEMGMSKTDAYVHFLRAGIESSLREESPDLARLERKIDQILYAFVQCPNREKQKEEVVAAVRRVTERYPQVRKVWLFGSFARGEQTDESDVDLRIELDPDSSFNLHDLEHYSKEIERLTGRDCDVVSAKRIKNKSLANAIERDKELIYEREKL